MVGAIVAAGSVLLVLNIRRRFGLPEREISPADQFLIAHTAHRRAVLVVDEAQGVIDGEWSFCESPAGFKKAYF